VKSRVKPVQSGDALSGLGAKVGFVNGSVPPPQANNQGHRALVSGVLAALENVIARTRANRQIPPQRISELTRRVKAMQVDYPVAVDSQLVIWRAFDNRYWPALYFIDTRGRARHTYVGEGAYEQSEMMIQRLLAEAGAESIGDGLVSVDPRGLEVAADWGSSKSLENYVGYERTDNLASPEGAVRDEPHSYALPASLSLNDWAMCGDWTMTREAAVLNKAGGRIACRFHTRDLHLVAGPAASPRPVKFRVLIGGRPPGAAHGTDVDEQGNGIVTEQRLCQLVRQAEPIVDREFQIDFLAPGVEAFAFTFG
jgi:Thioredoxin like C-terminal domain